jgi:hypothetical protein
MNYVIATTEFADRAIKQLAKKYHSIPDDLEVLEKELLKNPELGEDLGENTRKVRMAIASKNRGKSGGDRVITYLVYINRENGKIYLLTIYDKSERGSISKKEISQLKRESGLI